MHTGFERAGHWQWYPVQTKARQERVAMENLARQGFELYCPQVRRTCRRRGRWTGTVEPLFPRYLFIRIDPETCDISPIRSTRGVIGLVRFAHKLVPVPPPVLVAVRSAEDADGYVQFGAKNAFQTGDAVQILDGPFAGLAAIFESETGGRRVMILLEALGKLSRVCIDADHLGPAD